MRVNIEVLLFEMFASLIEFSVGFGNIYFKQNLKCVKQNEIIDKLKGYYAYHCL